MSDNRLKIGITQGDTNGVGWEVILRTFADQRMTELFTPVIYGSQKAAEAYMAMLDEEDYGVQFNVVATADEARRGKVNLVDTGDVEPQPGIPSAEGGKAAVQALEAAVADLKEGAIDAMVTAPIDKEMAQSQTFKYTGHTEFMAAHLEGEPMMIMCSDRLRVGLVTIHIPVAEVSRSISKEKILSSLATLRQTLKEDFGIVEPRIAVLALNPHAGDGGLRVASGGPLLIGIGHGHHVMGHAAHLLLRGSGGSHRHATVDLHGVHGDYFSVELLGDEHAHFRFSAGGRAHDTDDFRRHRHLLDEFSPAPPAGGPGHRRSPAERGSWRGQCPVRRQTRSRTGRCRTDRTAAASGQHPRCPRAQSHRRW